MRNSTVLDFLFLRVLGLKKNLYRPEGEVAPSQEVELHSRPATLLVNVPFTNSINADENAEDDIDVNKLDDLIQTLETIQEDMPEKQEDLETFEVSGIVNSHLLTKTSATFGRSTDTMTILDCDED